MLFCMLCGVDLVGGVLAVCTIPHSSILISVVPNFAICSVQDSKGDSSAALRPLNLDDFIQSKAKVKQLLRIVILLFLAV